MFGESTLVLPQDLMTVALQAVSVNGLITLNKSSTSSMLDNRVFFFDDISVLISFKGNGTLELPPNLCYSFVANNSRTSKNIRQLKLHQVV